LVLISLAYLVFQALSLPIFTILINFGFDLSATRAIASNRNNVVERNKIFNQVVLAKVLLFLVSIVLFTIALFTIPQLREEKEVAIFSFLLCLSWVITPNWLYQGMQELSRVAIFNLVTKVIFTVIILLVIKQKSDYVWQPLAISTAQIIVGIYSFTYALKRYSITLSRVKLMPVLELLWKERVIFFSMVVINLYTTTNVVLLGFLQSETQVGYYSAGYRLIVIIQSLIFHSSVTGHVSIYRISIRPKQGERSRCSKKNAAYSYCTYIQRGIYSLAVRSAGDHAPVWS
jgi:PST family polysaccharide transporter